MEKRTDCWAAIDATDVEAIDIDCCKQSTLTDSVDSGDVNDSACFESVVIGGKFDDDVGISVDCW